MLVKNEQSVDQTHKAKLSKYKSKEENNEKIGISLFIRRGKVVVSTWIVKEEEPGRFCKDFSQPSSPAPCFLGAKQHSFESASLRMRETRR